MKIPVNRHYYSLVTENVDSMCQTKTSGRGERESLRPGDLGGWGRGGPPSRLNRGEVCVLVFGGIDAPERGREMEKSRGRGEVRAWTFFGNISPGPN